MDLPDWVAEKMLNELKFTDGLILLGIFRSGSVQDGRAWYADGLRRLVPKASEDALREALGRLVAKGYVREEERSGQHIGRGRPPKALSVPLELSPGISPELSGEGSSRRISRGNSESEDPRVRARVPTAAAAADPLYPGIIRIFRIEGVVDPETQVDLFGIPAALAAVNELRARRRQGIVVATKPSSVLCHFGEKFRREGAPEVPNPERLLAEWLDPESEHSGLRAVK